MPLALSSTNFIPITIFATLLLKMERMYHVEAKGNDQDYWQLHLNFSL